MRTGNWQLGRMGDYRSPNGVGRLQYGVRRTVPRDINVKTDSLRNGGLVYIW